MATSIERVLIELSTIFDRLGIRYAVGGSVASSLYGEPRTTNAIDVSVDLRLTDIRPLVQALDVGWCVEPNAVERATAHNDMFQLLHEPTMLKVDVYVAELSNPLDRTSLERRRAIALADGLNVWFASPEDMVLRKLDWWRRSGGMLARQLRDVRGILRWQAGRLDLATVRREAEAMGLRAVLDDCLREPGGGSAGSTRPEDGCAV